MKQKSKRIIRTLLMSAIVSLLPSHSEEKELPPLKSDNNDSDQLSAVNTKVWRNVLKMSPTGKITSVDSHRSHSSHRSHYSSNHSSHYSSSPSTHYSSSGSYSTTPAKTYKTYSLGDRTLNQGAYGKDVNELVVLLKKYYYLRESYSTKKNEYSLYSEEVVQGIKYFQQDAGLTVTGVCDSKTKKALDGWSASKSVRRLGIRELQLNNVGADVTELIRLLTKAGYAPNPQTTDANTQVYTQDVAEAVKVFQALCGLEVTGNADFDAISKLKAKAK